MTTFERRIVCLLGTLLLSTGATHIPLSASEEQTTDQPLTFTGEDLETYQVFFHNPFVQRVRHDLDRYRHGGYKGLEASPVVKGVRGDGTDGLASFNSNYYSSPFFVVMMEPFTGGGETVSIVFMNRPDKMFDVWVYPLSGGQYETRAFTQDTSFSEQEIRFVYKNALATPQLGI